MSLVLSNIKDVSLIYQQKKSNWTGNSGILVNTRT